MSMVTLLGTMGSVEDNNVNHSYHSIRRVVKTICPMWNLKQILLCGCKKMTSQFLSWLQLEHIVLKNTPQK